MIVKTADTTDPRRVLLKHMVRHPMMVYFIIDRAVLRLRLVTCRTGWLSLIGATAMKNNEATPLEDLVSALQT
jgi:hypothetical protein